MRLISREAFLALPEGVLFCHQHHPSSPDRDELCVKGETRPAYGPVAERCWYRRLMQSHHTGHRLMDAGLRGESIPLDDSYTAEDAGTDLLDADYMACGYWVLEQADLDELVALARAAPAVRLGQ